MVEGSRALENDHAPEESYADFVAANEELFAVRAALHEVRMHARGLPADRYKAIVELHARPDADAVVRLHDSHLPPRQ